MTARSEGFGVDPERATSPTPGCAFYLARRHGLIKRHDESVELNADNTALWRLQIDFELPTNPAAFFGTPDAQGRRHFLFPIAFLRKAETRSNFEIRDETDTALSVPIRRECDRISGLAAAEAAVSLHPSENLPPAPFSVHQLAQILRAIAANKPFDSAMALEELLRQMGLGNREDDKREEPSDTGRAWERSGLTDVLHMLVEHSLIWLPLYGRPGERRTVVLMKQIEMVRRAFVRWVFCDLASLKPWLHPLSARRARNPQLVLELGEKRYGRRARRISFSALAERMGQPIAWTPSEFEFPTVYAKRCT